MCRYIYYTDSTEKNYYFKFIYFNLKNLVLQIDFYINVPWNSTQKKPICVLNSAKCLDL